MNVGVDTWMTGGAHLHQQNDLVCHRAGVQGPVILQALGVAQVELQHCRARGITNSGVISGRSDLCALSPVIWCTFSGSREETIVVRQASCFPHRGQGAWGCWLTCLAPLSRSLPLKQGVWVSIDSRAHDTAPTSDRNTVNACWVNRGMRV